MSDATELDSRGLNKDQRSRCEIFKKTFTPRQLIEAYVTAESDYGQKAVGCALDGYPFNLKA